MNSRPRDAAQTVAALSTKPSVKASRTVFFINCFLLDKLPEDRHPAVLELGDTMAQPFDRIKGVPLNDCIGRGVVGNFQNDGGGELFGNTASRSDVDGALQNGFFDPPAFLLGHALNQHLAAN